ncbi:MAG: SDR family oxidoreductase [Cryobacterium sp.]|nr:SDR family oxidoreductase [Cryobacterium sp.]
MSATELFAEAERAFFRDAVAVVAGGTSGVGLAAAQRFAAAGARRILLIGRNRERGASVVSRFEAAHPEVEVVFESANLLEADDALRVVASAIDRWGAIDILVNSVNGSHGPRLLHRTDIHDLFPQITSQLMGVVHMCRAAVPSMQERGTGVIVNIASDAAKSPTPGEAAIGAAMAGIVMFTRTMAMELKRNGIRANVVTPSIIEGTGGYERVMQDEFTAKLFGKAIPLAHLGVVNAEDMAELIAFLCSPRSGKLTGQAISLNGGISAH